MPCPRCGARKYWTLKNGRRRCARCRYDWNPDRLPLRLTRRQWRALLEWFVRGMTSAQIAHETGLERKRILRALTIVRSAMLDAAPAPARPLGLRWHTDHAHSDARTEALARQGRPRPAVLGLRLMGDYVWAEVVASQDAEWLVRSVRERRHGRGVIGPTLDYGAIVYRSRLYRLPTSGEGQPAAPFGQLEGFWAYLHQRLRSKGGIRRGRLGLYLAEYAWRYNHRRLTPREQIRELFKLIGPRRPGVRIATLPNETEPDYDGGGQVIR
jgi:transposase